MSWLDTFTDRYKQKFSEKLLKHAIETADAVRNLANEGSDGKTDIKVGDIKWFSILFEIIYLYLYLINLLSICLKDEQRATINKWITEVVIDSAVETHCKGWDRDKIEGVKKDCWRNFFIAMEEYSQYQKLFPEKDEGTKGTLFWEFSKNISKLAGHENNPALIIACEAIVVTSLKGLDIKSFIENIMVGNKTKDVQDDDIVRQKDLYQKGICP